MSVALITPHNLSGTINVPPSKSQTHRAIICALLARDVSEIYPVDVSNDIMSTINAVRAFGASVQFVSNRLLIDSRYAFRDKSANIDCCECGSTLRFFIPIAAAFSINTCFNGRDSLRKRPLKVYLDVLSKFGVYYASKGGLPLQISGKLFPGEYKIPGNISSQFISGLLLSLPTLNADSEIVLTTLLESSSYIDMTIHVMKKFGVNVIKTERGYRIPGNQKYKPAIFNVEGDWSQGAFFIAAGLLGSPMVLRGLDKKSVQGDRAIVSIIERMGGDIEHFGKEIRVYPSKLSGTRIYASQIPDLVPILSILAASANGVTEIFGASRLRFKESNRLNAIYSNLNKLGVKVTELDDGLLIEGRPSFLKANLNGYNDHRIVMAMAIAAIRAQGKICIDDANSIGKSYPMFFEEYNRLKGIVNVLDL